MPTGWFGKISWPVFLHCKSTAIIWLHNTHENTPERKYKMPDYILQFFNSSYWALISNVFTAIGVISVIPVSYTHLFNISILYPLSKEAFQALGQYEKEKAEK